MSEPSDPESTPLLPVVIAPTVTAARAPQHQLGDLPQEELEAMAEEFGLDARRFRGKPELVSAIHARRQLIATLDRQAMQDILEWAGRPVSAAVSQEQMAIEIVHVRSMRFAGLSERGLIVLSLLRGVDVRGDETRDQLIKQLKKQEGFVAKLRRKTRGWVGKRIERMMGDSTTELPAPTPQPQNARTDVKTAAGVSGPAAGSGPRQQALREEIEESGFFSGIANRVKKQADSYVNQKLDEIEARIDRKLDEIDRRLAEWRDKEIANRIRILKITLWASVVVAAVSLIYTYVKVEAKRWNQPNTPPSTTRTSLVVPSSSTANMATPIATRTNPPSAS